MKKFAVSVMLLASAVCQATPQEDAFAAFKRGDYKAAIALLEPLAEAGDPDALANLGNMYAFGQGVPVDKRTATTYWFKAAEKHVPTAMGNIASCYKTGDCGLAQSDEQALAWFKRAAEHRHAPSMLVLSSAYLKGEGVEQDKVKALAWASLAATNSNIPAVTRMATDQTYRMAQSATRGEIDQANELSAQLRRLIDENHALYRSQ